MAQSRLPSPLDPSPFSYVVGIDIGSQHCSRCVLRPDKRVVHKASLFANTAAGFQLLQNKLAGLGVSASQILIGMEATSRYGDALFHFLQQQGYQLCLLYPAQTHQFAQQRGLRAKTDKLDAVTIAHVLLSGEARVGYVPDELISSYRELVRLHTHLTDEIARYKNENHALLQVLFPEFSQVFADPCRPTALAVLQCYPSAAALSRVSVEELTALLQRLAPRNYGRQTAQTLLELTGASVSPGLAPRARSTSMRILCDQLTHTRENLAQVEAGLEQLQEQDSGSAGYRSLETRRWRCCEPNWAMWLVSSASTRRWPRLAWIWRSEPAANGKGRPSEPLVAVGCCGGSCIWPPCVLST